jgi:hypothetical protein
VIVTGAYFVMEIATKLFHIKIEGENVLFRRMAVLMWERDVFTRAAAVLVEREKGGEYSRGSLAENNLKLCFEIVLLFLCISYCVLNCFLDK